MTPEKAELGKLPTDVWWHTIVSPTGREKTGGYPTQKPEAILRRIVQASTREGDWVLDFFAGSGTTGKVAAALGRRFVLVDENPEAIEVMRARFKDVTDVSFETPGDASPPEHPPGTVKPSPLQPAAGHHFSRNQKAGDR